MHFVGSMEGLYDGSTSVFIFLLEELMKFSFIIIIIIFILDKKTKVIEKTKLLRPKLEIRLIWGACQQFRTVFKQGKI